MARVGSPPTRTPRTPRRSASPIALALAFVLGNLFNAALLAPLGHSGGAATSGQALAAPLPDGGGQALVGQPVTPRRVALHPSTTPPTPTAQQRQAHQATPDRLRQYRTPVGPIHQLTAAETAALARTAGPPLPPPTSNNTLHLNPKAPTTPKTAPGGPQADSDFDLEQVTTIGSWGLCGSCSFSTVGPDMSVANDGNTYLAVGNFFGAVYTASGSTMAYEDPNAVAGLFGESFVDGTQQVLYEPSRAMFLWVLQTYAPNYHLVLANLSGSCFYDLTPTSFGLPSGDHLLTPDLEYSSNYLYLSFVLLDSSFNFADAGVGRIALSPLQACGTLAPQAVVRSDNGSFTLGQGVTDTIYWLSNDYLSGPTNGNHVRVFFWAESSGSYTYLDKSIDAYSFLAPGSSPNCASQDGKVINWCSNLDSTAATLYRSRAGYRGFGAPLLGMAWPAGPTTGISPYPYVVREYFLLANMAYKGHDNVYNANYAVAWPSLASPTTRGYVGGAFTFGGGTGNIEDTPGSFYLIEDPDTPTQPWSTYYVGGAGNTNMFTNSWGYTMARAWNPDELHWVAAGWYETSGSSSGAYVVVFGRGRDHQAYLRWVTS